MLSCQNSIIVLYFISLNCLYCIILYCIILYRIVSYCIVFICLSDCGPLEDPCDGHVVTASGTTLNQQATYACDLGFVPDISSVRTCQADGTWSGVKPCCDLGWYLLAMREYRPPFKPDTTLPTRLHLNCAQRRLNSASASSLSDHNRHCRLKYALCH